MNPNNEPSLNYGAPHPTTSTAIDGHRRSSSLSAANAVVNKAFLEWEQMHAKELEQRREKEAKFKESAVKQAEQQLAAFYKEREERLQKVRQENRVAQQQRADGSKKANDNDNQSSWARICDLIEQIEERQSTAASLNEEKRLSVGSKKGSPAAAVGVSSTDGSAGSSSNNNSACRQVARDTSRMLQLLLQRKADSLGSPMLSNSLP